MRRKLLSITRFLVKPYRDWLSEDYFIFHLREIEDAPPAEELIRQIWRKDRTAGARRYGHGSRARS